MLFRLENCRLISFELNDGCSYNNKYNKYNMYRHHHVCDDDDDAHTRCFDMDLGDPDTNH